MAAREDELLDRDDAEAARARAAAEEPPGPNDVTPVRAWMLAQHATLVQGGVSDPAREAARAEAQLAESPGSIDWAKMTAEVGAAALDAARREGDHDRSKVTRLDADDVAARTRVADEAADVRLGEPSIDFALLRQYRDLREREKIAKAEADAYKDEANRIEAQLIEMFTDAEMQNLSVDGKTLYLHRSVYAQRCAGIDAETVRAVLERVAPDLVQPTVNGQTLSAWVRELTEDDDAPGLPDELDGILEPGEKFSIRINAAASKAKGRRK